MLFSEDGRKGEDEDAILPAVNNGKMINENNILNL
jgi:hypothetical protein